jgi:hypothetical protein
VALFVVVVVEQILQFCPLVAMMVVLQTEIQADFVYHSKQRRMWRLKQKVLHCLMT